MKRNLKYIIVIFTLLHSLCFILSGCIISFGNSKYPPKEIIIFRFIDEEYKNKIITNENSVFVKNHYEKYFTPITSDSSLYVPLYPYVDTTKPIFAYADESDPSLRWDMYELCELGGGNDKIIELHDGWCMYFPYRWDEFGWPNLAIDAEWKDICNPAINFDSVPILGYPYKHRMYGVYADKIAKLQKKKVEELMIEDVVSCLNKMIDEDNLNKYAYIYQKY